MRLAFRPECGNPCCPTIRTAPCPRDGSTRASVRVVPGVGPPRHHRQPVLRSSLIGPALTPALRTLPLTVAATCRGRGAQRRTGAPALLRRTRAIATVRSPAAAACMRDARAECRDMVATEVCRGRGPAALGMVLSCLTQRAARPPTGGTCPDPLVHSGRNEGITVASQHGWKEPGDGRRRCHTRRIANEAARGADSSPRHFFR